MKKEALKGLVVCGGASSRMGRDKSLLKYHDQPQRQHIAAMLQVHCSQVFLSLNATQFYGDENYPALRDLKEYGDIGPLAALLTAFHHFPQSNFIVIGCDYPLLTGDELQGFIRSLHHQDQPKAFYNEPDGFYEPLLAYYPAAMAAVLKQHFMDGNLSLQRILKASGCARYFPQDKNSISSIDKPEDYSRVKQQIDDQKGRK